MVSLSLWLTFKQLWSYTCTRTDTQFIGHPCTKYEAHILSSEPLGENMRHITPTSFQKITKSKFFVSYNGQQFYLEEIIAAKCISLAIGANAAEKCFDFEVTKTWNILKRKIDSAILYEMKF